MKQTLLALGLVALLALSSTPAHADAAVEFTGFGISGNQHSNIGWVFTTNANIVVTDLGYYDFGDDGLAAGHEVGIFASNGTLLGQTIVDPSLSPKIDGFFYEPISGGPIFLQEDRRYIIMATNRAQDPYVGAVTGFTTIPEITYGGGAFNPNGFGLQFPTQFFSPQGQFAPELFGPNFRTVPEPASLALVTLGSLAIAYRRRRRKAMNA